LPHSHEKTVATHKQACLPNDFIFGAESSAY